MTARRKLRIAENLTLPLEAATETFAILAKRGAGKTYTAKVMTEELLKAGVPTVVVDPLGVWWGLRAGADGNPAGGLPITILGGDHGDAPLNDGAGETVADLVVNERIPLVLDLSLMRKAEARRFMLAFADRLYHRNREAVHLMVDEADAFAPQRPQKGAEALLGSMEDLVRRGRARGIGITLISQRSAVLNKDVLTQAEVLIVLRTIAPQDRNAVETWVEVHGDRELYHEVLSTLHTLELGEAWIWSPAWLGILKRVQIRKARTFDSSSTPKAGAKVKAPRKLTPVDLEALEVSMAETIEEAKASDPAELRRRVAALTAEVERAHERGFNEALERAKADPPKRLEVPILVDADHLTDAVRAATEYAKGADKVHGALVEALERTTAGLAHAVELVEKIGDGMVQTDPTHLVPQRYTTPTERAELSERAKERARVDISEKAASDGAPLVAGARRMLHVIATNPGGLTEGQVATLAKVKRSTGTWYTYRSRLTGAGLVVAENGRLRPTEAGIAAAGAPAPVTGEEHRSTWRERLTGGARRMFDELLKVYPDAVHDDDLSARAGVKRSTGTWYTYRSRLVSNGLAEETSGGLRATDVIAAP